MSGLLFSDKGRATILADMERTPEPDRGQSALGFDVGDAVLGAPGRAFALARLGFAQRGLDLAEFTPVDRAEWDRRYEELQAARQNYETRLPRPEARSLAGDLVRGVVDPLLLTAAGAATGVPGAGIAGGYTAGDAMGSYEVRKQIDPIYTPFAAPGSVDALYADETASRAGMIQGASMAAGFGIPGVVGKTLTQRLASGAAINAGFGVADRFATQQYLRARGYDDAAELYQAFDPTALAIDAVLGLGFGGLHHLGEVGRQRAEMREQLRKLNRPEWRLDVAPAEIQARLTDVEQMAAGAVYQGRMTADEALAELGKINEGKADDTQREEFFALLEEIGKRKREAGESTDLRVISEAAAAEAPRWPPEVEAAIVRRAEAYARDNPDMQPEQARALAEDDAVNHPELLDLPRPSSDQVAAALVSLDTLRDDASGPGIPRDLATYQDHLDFLNAAARQMENDEPVDIEAMVLEAIYARDYRAPRMTSLIPFLIQRGGLLNEGGDLAAVLGGRSGRDTRIVGLLNDRSGLSLDDATLYAWEQGYLPGAERPTTDVLLAAIQDETAGNKVYSEADAQAAYEAEQVDRARNDLGRRGIDIARTDAEIRQQVEQYFRDNFAPHKPSPDAPRVIEAVEAALVEAGVDDPDIAEIRAAAAAVDADLARMRAQGAALGIDRDLMAARSRQLDPLGFYSPVAEALPTIGDNIWNMGWQAVRNALEKDKTAKAEGARIREEIKTLGLDEAFAGTKLRGAELKAAVQTHVETFRIALGVDQAVFDPRNPPPGFLPPPIRKAQWLDNAEARDLPMANVEIKLGSGPNEFLFKTPYSVSKSVEFYKNKSGKWAVRVGGWGDGGIDAGVFDSREEAQFVATLAFKSENRAQILRNIKAADINAAENRFNPRTQRLDMGRGMEIWDVSEENTGTYTVAKVGDEYAVIEGWNQWDPAKRPPPVATFPTAEAARADARARLRETFVRDNAEEDAVTATTNVIRSFGNIRLAGGDSVYETVVYYSGPLPGADFEAPDSHIGGKARRSDNSNKGVIYTIHGEVRTDDKGQRTLSVSQLQSDLAQQIRAGKDEVVHLDKRIGELLDVVSRMTADDVALVIPGAPHDRIEMYPDIQAASAAALKHPDARGMYGRAGMLRYIDGLQYDLNIMRQDVSDIEGAPLTAKTSQWTLSGVRALVYRAAQEGFDSVAFPTAVTSGEIQGNTKAAAHYDENVRPALEKVARAFGGSVRAGTVDAPGWIEANPGRWIGAKIEANDIVTVQGPITEYVIRATDGRSLGAFSDEQAARTYLAREEARAQRLAGADKNRAPMYIMDITPAMRAEILQRGMPMFAKGAPAPRSRADDLRMRLWPTLARLGKLLPQDFITVVQSTADLPEDVRARLGDADTTGLKGLADKRNGRVYLIADNVAPRELMGLVLHEVGVHLGLKKLIGDRGYAEAIRQLQAMREAGVPEVVRAFETAEREALLPEHVNEEAMAYLVQNAPEMPLVQRILATLAQWANKYLGTRFATPEDIALGKLERGDLLTIEDMRNLAMAATQRFRADAREVREVGAFAARGTPQGRGADTSVAGGLTEKSFIRTRDLEGATIIPMFADLTDAGRVYDKLDGMPVAPTSYLGGPNFPWLRAYRDAGVVWAFNDKGKITGLRNKVAETRARARAEGRSERVVVTMLAMKDDAHTSNEMTISALLRTLDAVIDAGRFPKDQLDAAKELIVSKAGKADDGYSGLSTFPGFGDAEALHDWSRRASFNTRKALAKEMQSAAFQQLPGMFPVARIVREAIDPDYRATQQGDALLAFEIDPDAADLIIDFDDPAQAQGVPRHPAYRFGLRGSLVGSFSTHIPMEVLYGDLLPEVIGRAAPGSNPKFLMERLRKEDVQVVTPDIVREAEIIEGLHDYRVAQTYAAGIAGQWRSSDVDANKGGINPVEFERALAENEAAATLTPYSRADVKEGRKNGTLRVFQLGAERVQDGGLNVWMGVKAGVDYRKEYPSAITDKLVEDGVLSPDETVLVGVASNELGVNGVSTFQILKGVQEGVTALDAFKVKSAAKPDGLLPSIYATFGFEEVAEIPFAPEYYSAQQLADLEAVWSRQGWNKDDGYPPVVIMKWRGSDALRAEATRKFILEGQEGLGIGSGPDVGQQQAEAARVLGGDGPSNQSNGRSGQGDGRADPGRYADRARGVAGRARDFVENLLAADQRAIKALKLPQELVDRIRREYGALNPVGYAPGDAGSFAAIDPPRLVPRGREDLLASRSTPPKPYDPLAATLAENPGLTLPNGHDAAEAVRVARLNVTKAEAMGQAFETAAACAIKAGFGPRAAVSLSEMIAGLTAGAAGGAVFANAAIPLMRQAAAEEAGMSRIEAMNREIEGMLDGILYDPERPLTEDERRVASYYDMLEPAPGVRTNDYPESVKPGDRFFAGGASARMGGVEPAGADQ